MILSDKKVILGSNSPRRRELLSLLDIDFKVDAGTDFKEEIPPGVGHRDIPLFMAKGKSDKYYRNLEDDEILITADTMVLCEGKILGKPHSCEEAVEMLKMLSGKWHEVITGVCIRSDKKTVSFSVSTEVHFTELGKEELYYYVNKYKPYDKAGAYGIQEWIGCIGADCIRGSYFNIVGLPVQKVYSILKSFR